MLIPNMSEFCSCSEGAPPKYLRKGMKVLYNLSGIVHFSKKVF